MRRVRPPTGANTVDFWQLTQLATSAQIDKAMGEPIMVELEQARGLRTGLLPGDALAHKQIDRSKWILGSPASQLACFSVEGMIRAWVRHAGKGICHPPSVVWHAYQRGVQFRVATRPQQELLRSLA